jgi:hypothetical protein
MCPFGWSSISRRERRAEAGALAWRERRAEAGALAWRERCAEAGALACAHMVNQLISKDIAFRF